MDNSSLIGCHRGVSLGMSAEQKSDEDKLATIRVTNRTKRRFELQGVYGMTADQVLRSILDQIETCRCRPARRVTT